MNLSGDILFDALAESFVVKKYGHYSQVLSLQRPRLYSGWGREFEENCLYIAQGEQPVSYTHLDVYKRQCLVRWFAARFPCTFPA